MNFSSKDLSTLLCNAPRKARETPAPSTRRAQPRGMNKWESDYARHLGFLQSAGEIVWFGFEMVRLWIGKASDEPGARPALFKPDFCVVTVAGATEFHEVKGFWREAAKSRMKTAAALYPFRFVVVRKVKGVWATVEVFNGN